MQITRRDLYDAAMKIGQDTIYDANSADHRSLLSASLTFLSPAPRHLQDDDNTRQLLLLSPKGEAVIRLEME